MLIINNIFEIKHWAWFVQLVIKVNCCLPFSHQKIKVWAKFLRNNLPFIKIIIFATDLPTSKTPKPKKFFKNFPEKNWDLGPNPWYLGYILKMKNLKGYHATPEEYLTTHQGKVSLACAIFSASEKSTLYQLRKIIKLLKCP